MDSTPEQTAQQVLTEHAAFVERLALLLVGPAAAHDAEDLVQDTYLRVLRRKPRSVALLRPWLKRVMHGLASSGRRAASRRRETEEFAAEKESRDENEEPLEKLEIKQIVVRAVLDLPELYRTTMLLRYYDDLSHAQIADRERIALETVTTRLRRGAKILRESLERNPAMRGSLQHALAPFVPGPAPSSAPTDALSLPVSRIMWLTAVGLVTLVLAFLARSCFLSSGAPGLEQRWDQDLTYRLEASLDTVGHDVTRTGPQGNPTLALNTSLEVVQELAVSDRTVASASSRVAFDRSFRRVRQQSRVQGGITTDGRGTSIDETRSQIGPLEGGERTLEADGIDELSLRLEGLIAGRALTVGDSWSIEPALIGALFAPLDVRPPPTSVTAEDLVRGTHKQGSEQWFGPAAGGSVSAGVTGIRTEGGRRLAQVELELELDDRIDLLGAPLVTPADATVQLGKMDAGAHFTGRGTLIWNLDDGRFVSLEIEGNLTIGGDFGGSIQEAGGVAQVTRSSRLAGPARISIRAK